MILLIFILSLLLRLNNLQAAPHFADMDWFFNSAKIALHTGHLPMLGITSSITWLHQGPLWTYFLLLPEVLSIPPIVFTIVAGALTVVLVHLSVGLLPALVVAVLPLAISQSQAPYHTSLIPLFFFTAYLCLNRKKSYLTGLFIGFLYQLHLLTFIYWPLFAYLAYRKQLDIKRLSLGFALGILPFIIAGPVQTLGIFVWALKQIFTGFAGTSSGISTAYWVVLLPGIILILSWVLKWVYAHGNSAGKK